MIVRALTDPASREDGAPLVLFHDTLQLAAGQAILQQVTLYGRASRALYTPVTRPH